MPRRKRISDEALLTAAREAFVLEGFGASTRVIARSAGVSEAVLFQRFRTKLDLFFAAMVPPPFDVARLVAARPPGDDVAAALEAIALEAMAYFRGVMPVLVQLVTHPAFTLDELRARQAELPLHDLHAAVAGFLAEQRRAGHVGASPREIEVAVLTLVAALHSYALFERMGLHGGAVPDAAVRGTARVIAAGLAASTRRAPRGGRR